MCSVLATFKQIQPNCRTLLLRQLHTSLWSATTGGGDLSSDMRGGLLGPIAGQRKRGAVRRVSSPHGPTPGHGA